MYYRLARMRLISQELDRSSGCVESGLCCSLRPAGFEVRLPAPQLLAFFFSFFLIFFKTRIELISHYRNYPEVKLQENIDSEIMEVLLEEARDSYDEEIVVELRSDSNEDLESNIERIQGWLKQWKEDNKPE